MKYFDNWRYDFHKLKEKIIMKIVWLLPKIIVYLCVIRVWSYVTSGERPYCNLSPGSVTIDQALNAWADPVVCFSIQRKKLTLEQLDKIANYTTNNNIRWENEITEKTVNIKFWSSSYDFRPFFEYIGVPIEKFHKK